MVFVDYKIKENPGTALLIVRDTGKYAALLVIESLFGTTVAVSNIIIISVMIAGWKRLMKNNFYVIVATLSVFTSLKGFVELAFILPYYIMRGDRNGTESGYFSTNYEHVIFNLSVFADYGILFVSVLVAANRLIAVTRNGVCSTSRTTTVMLCAFVCVCAAVIPLIFFFCKCQYVYSKKTGVYFNKCAILADPSPAMFIVIDSLVYLSYVCCLITLVLYVLIFASLRRKRRQSLSNDNSFTSPELRLLRQSFAVFLLYSARFRIIVQASIALVLILTFSPKLSYASQFIDISDIAYVENLLNLSIAAVYPICFLAMSGEMKRILIEKLLPTRTERVASISLNNNNNNKNKNNNG